MKLLKINYRDQIISVKCFGGITILLLCKFDVFFNLATFEYVFKFRRDAGFLKESIKF